MCFNSSNNTASDGIIRPTRKPDLASNDGSILGNIWNSATNTFDRLTSFELDLYQQKRLADLRQGEEAAKVDRQRELAGTNGIFTSNPINSTGALLGVGMIAIAAILLIRG